MDILAKSAYICSSYSQRENGWNFIEGVGTSLLLSTLFFFKTMTKCPMWTGDFLQM